MHVEFKKLAKCMVLLKSNHVSDMFYFTGVKGQLLEGEKPDNQ